MRGTDLLFASAMATLFASPLLAASCSGSQPGARTVQAYCYLVADQEAEERFDTECPGMTVDECPFTNDILDELEARQRECRP